MADDDLEDDFDDEDEEEVDEDVHDTEPAPPIQEWTLFRALVYIAGFVCLADAFESCTAHFWYAINLH